MAVATTQARPTRADYVGSGDIAAIVGCDERRNAADVWLQKTGQVPDVEMTSPMKRGVALEPYVLDLFEAEHGVTLARDVFVRGDDVCGATLDGAMLNADTTVLTPETLSDVMQRFIQPYIEADVEAKTTNMGKDWNRETGAIPLITVVQTNYQMYCAGPQCLHAFVPALIPEFQRFKFLSPVPIVKRNDELIEELKIAAHEFWECVRTGKQPTNAVPHLESLKRIRREPESVISLGDEAAELWNSYEQAGQRAKSAEADKEEYKRSILVALGTSEAGRLADGRLITFLEQSGARHIDADRLQVLNPALYEQLVTQVRFRVLRIKKAKLGKQRR
jgi:predicted phage-related endonuclease